MRVDRNTVYSSGDYTFRNFTAISNSEIKSVWTWRNEESIRRFMYNKDVIPFESHLRFVESLSDKEDVYYWLVERKGEVAGVTNLTSVDLEKSRAELGYYMIPEMQKKGIGIDFAFNNFDFAFSKIGVDTLFGGIDKRNYNAITLDSYLGCVLNTNDIENIDTVEYIRWEVKQKDFMTEREGKNDFRSFVRYLKENRDLFDKFKKYA